MITHVGLVIDTSGSMECIWDEAFSGFMDQIKTFKEMPEEAGEYTLTAVPFDSEVPVHLPSLVCPMADVDPDVFQDLRPSGYTALNDGIMRCLQELSKHDSEDEDEDVAFLVYIFSDGAENASQEFDTSAVRKKMEDLKAGGNWTINLIGCNQIAEHTAGHYGLGTGDALTFRGTAQGTARAGGVMRAAAMSYAAQRTAGVKAVDESYTEAMKAEAMQPDAEDEEE